MLLQFFDNVAASIKLNDFINLELEIFKPAQITWLNDNN